MILDDLTYHRPATVQDAVTLLARLGDGAAVLAGGQSLLPAMKAGQARPTTLVDIGRIPALAAIRDGPGYLAVGAMVRHHDLAVSPAVTAKAPLLARAAAEIADPQVRHRGTIGGSMAQAAAAADLPVALLALDAVLVTASTAGAREIPVGDFFLGAGRTALRAGELLVQVRLPDPPVAAWSYQKYHRDALQWSLLTVAAVRPADAAAPVRVAVANLGDRPVLASAVTDALARGAGTAQAAALADRATQAAPDERAGIEYRRHLARVLTARALTQLSQV